MNLNLRISEKKNKNKLLCTDAFNSSGGCSYRVHQLHLCRGVRLPPHLNKCPRYDTKQSDDEAPVMLELWGMWSIPSLPLLPVLP